MAKLRTFEKVERGLIRKKLDEIDDLKIQDDCYPEIQWFEDSIIKENLEKVKDLSRIRYFFIGTSLTGGGMGICAYDIDDRIYTLSTNHYTKPDLYKFILKYLGQDTLNEIINNFININNAELLLNAHNIEKICFAPYYKEDIINYSYVYFKNNEKLDLPLYNETFKQEKARIEKQLERIKELNKTC